MMTSARETHSGYAVTLKKIQKFLQTYMTFPDENYSLVLSLWVIATFIFPDFDAFPYLVITSSTKRSGKTRLSELMSFVCSNPCNSGALTPAAIFRKIEESQPTLFFDEAETLSGESASAQRSILNMGYRKGNVVARVVGQVVREFKTYCPKVFILIGDVYDTLRDRSIVVTMKRGEPAERFVWSIAQDEGAIIRDEVSAMMEENHSALVSYFTNDFKGIEFLTDRDEEIWTPLFVIAEVLFPEVLQTLKRAAMDMSTEKTQDSRKYSALLEKSEKGIETEEYGLRLLDDMHSIMDGKNISTMEAIEKLRKIDIAPWRKFRGTGITANNIADLLSPFGVRVKPIRTKGKRTETKVFKGYAHADIVAAIKKLKA